MRLGAISYLEMDAKMIRNVWNNALRTLMMGIALLWLCGGCAHLERIIQPKSESPSVEDPQAPEPNPFVHEVQWPGESLSIIAKWYTGDGTNWKALAKANTGLNPNLIRIGDRIVIPRSILENEKQMPRDFLPSSSQRTEETRTPGTDEAASGNQELGREQLELLDEVWDVSLEP